MIIRKAVAADIDAMARLWLAMMHEVYPEHTPNAEWWREDRWAEMESGIYVAYVAEEEGALVGFTDALIYRDPPRGHIVAWSNHSYIIPEYRHGGLTRDLYGSIYVDFRSRGAKIVMFACTDKLAEFWKTHGYREIENVMMGEI